MNEATVKALVRHRDGRCVECGMTNEEHVAKFGRQLDVHRIVPGSKYTLEGCVTLCRPCHGPQPRRSRNSILRVKDPATAAAVLLHARRTGREPREVVCAALRSFLPDEFSEADKFLASRR
jgi:hypothetical protein